MSCHNIIRKNFCLGSEQAHLILFKRTAFLEKKKKKELEPLEVLICLVYGTISNFKNVKGSIKNLEGLNRP